MPDGRGPTADRWRRPTPGAPPCGRRGPPRGRPPSASTDGGSACADRTRSPPRPRRAPARRPECPTAPPRAGTARRRRPVRRPRRATAAGSSAGSELMRRTKPSSIAAADERLPEIQKPPASSAAETFRGTSSRASGMPRVSATMRSRTRGSIPPSITDSSSSRASPSDRPSITSSGRPASTSGAIARPRRPARRARPAGARDEAQGLHRHLVEPLRVVDDAEQGLVVGGGGHQAQHRQARPGNGPASARRRGRTRRPAPRAAVPAARRRGPSAARTAAAAPRRRVPCRTARPPPGRSGNPMPVRQRSRAVRVLPTPASPRSTSTWQLSGSGGRHQAVAASRIRWRARADALPPPSLDFDHRHRS